MAASVTAVSPVGSRGDRVPAVVAQPGTAAAASRLPFVSLLRALAAQLIVLHHLAFYGPLSDIAYPLAPLVIDLLFDYGRFAVQVFFVLGGFMTARSLAGTRELGARALARIFVKRYQRIGLPYLVTLGIAVAANALADRWMDHGSISPPPSVVDLLAHAVFLQHLLGRTIITAGIWFLAVDFQLFVLVFVVGAAARGLSRACDRVGPVRDFVVLQAVCWPLALLSIFWLNRDADLDVWGLYFFGSYFLGMLLHWTLAGQLGARWFWVYAATMVVGVTVEWRPRLVVALLTAVAVWGMARATLLERWPRSRLVERLGASSYSLFLIHFPLCLVVNAVVVSFEPSPLGALAGITLAYVASQGAGLLFHRFVEAPCMRLRLGRG